MPWLLTPLLGRAQPTGRRTRLIMLGTAGGPWPHKGRGFPANAVVIDGVVYVVDCGNGVARQLASPKVPLTALRHVFLTITTPTTTLTTAICSG